MKQRHRRHGQWGIGRVATLAVVLAMPLSLHAKTVDPWDGGWHFTVSPYAWLPDISASMRFQVADTTVINHSTGDLWDNLSGAFELKGTARKGRWGVFANLDWVDFNNMRGRSATFGPRGSSITFDSSWDLRGGLVDLDGLYDLAHGRAGYADLLFGARYVRITGTLDWNLSADPGVDFAQTGHRHQHVDVLQPVVGVRGRWQPTHGRFFVPFHADYGNNGSTSSSQASVGVGYAFGWGDASLSWRQVWLQQDGDSRLLKRLTLRGPSLDLTWHF